MLKNEFLTECEYEGKVECEILFNNAPVTVKHNAGLEALQLAFAILMSGNDPEKYVPYQIDITWDGVSILTKPLELSGSRYDKIDREYVAIHNSLVDIGQVKTTVPQNVPITLILKARNGLDLATVSVLSTETVCLVSTNVSAMITWVMKLKI